MSAIYLTGFILLAVSLVITAVRLFRGPTAADRVLAIDLLAVIAASAVLLHCMSSGEAVILDVVVVLGAMIFFGTVALARTISRNP